MNIYQFWKPPHAKTMKCVKTLRKLRKINVGVTSVMKSTKIRKHELSLKSRLMLNRNNITINKCNEQRLKTSDRWSLIMCGDVQLNPGPESSLMLVFATRLARIGLKPVNIVGDGNCFFRSVSHQLYATESYHSQIRALAIQHLINCPEHFIESNTSQSWLQYLQNMSRLGIWANHIIIQAVANSHNLKIHITESALNFAETTIVSPIYTDADANSRTRNIFIGHLDEVHYVSTSPLSQSLFEQAKQQTPTSVKQLNVNTDCEHNMKPNTILNSKNPHKTFSDDIAAQLKSRKEYMRAYMKKKRMNDGFKTKENKRKKIYNKTYRQSKAEKVKQSMKKAYAAYKQLNPSKAKKSSQKTSAVYKQSSPDKVQASKRKYNHSNRNKVKISQQKQHFKRKMGQCDSETELKGKKFRSYVDVHKNSCHINSDSRTPISTSEAIAFFQKKISVGPEYICTCCDQLWYKSSVTECNPSMYKSCSKKILNLCLTGLKSIDNTEWICGTCHSNLKVRKLPSCAKANKMTFPEKPEVLQNLTPLEERLISPRIPFMQVRELPSGSQLSIHGNIVNVPADVNTTVSVLPRPINESQTIPIKLKRRLGYKHHYQFQNVRPSKVLDAAQYLVRTSEMFKNEGIQVMDNYASNPVNNDEEWSEFITKNTKETSDNQSNNSVEYSKFRNSRNTSK